MTRPQQSGTGKDFSPCTAAASDHVFARHLCWLRASTLANESKAGERELVQPYRWEKAPVLVAPLLLHGGGIGGIGGIGGLVGLAGFVAASLASLRCSLVGLVAASMPPLL